MSGERTYCVALTREQMELIFTGAWDRSLRNHIGRRLSRINLEEQSPPPGPPLPLIAVEPTHTGIKFGGEI